MIPEWTIGDRLAKARRAADLTVGDMAKRLEVHRNSVSAWENGRHRPRRRFASRAYAAERDYRAVQELLGHSSMVTTQRYVAVPSGALAAAVRAAAA